MATWYTVEEARTDWLDAESIADDAAGNELLQSYLDAAQDAILAFAPARYSATPTPTAPTEGMRRAHLMQTQNLWNATAASPSGNFDNGSFGLSAFPLDWQVKQLVRPRRGIPVIA
jgi:hypothetical protein